MEPILGDFWTKELLRLSDSLSERLEFWQVLKPYIVESVLTELVELKEASDFLLPTGFLSERENLEFNMLKVIQENHERFKGIESVRDEGIFGVIPMYRIDPLLKAETLESFLKHANERYNTTPLDILTHELRRLQPQYESDRRHFGDIAFGSFMDAIMTAFHMNMMKKKDYKVTVITDERKAVSTYLKALLRDHASPRDYGKEIDALKDRSQEKAKEALERGDRMVNPAERPVVKIPKEPVTDYNMLLAGAKTLEQEEHLRAQTKVIARECYPLVKCFKAPAPHFVAKLDSIFEVRGRRFKSSQLGVLDEAQLTALRPDLFQLFLDQNIKDIVSGSITDYLKRYSNPKI